jgi:hypothetical protein
MMAAVDDIGKVVNAMKSDLQLQSIFGESLAGLAPFYLFGHRLDIANRLLIKENDAVYKYQKYPLIALIMDFPELVADGMAKYTLHVVILDSTDPNYTIEDRYSKVFKPVLYPLYYKFLEYLRKVGKFTWQGDQGYPPHTKIDRPFWGTVYDQGNAAYIFNDRLDAIELSDLKISKTIKLC